MYSKCETWKKATYTLKTLLIESGKGAFGTQISLTYCCSESELENKIQKQKSKHTKMS